MADLRLQDGALLFTGGQLSFSDACCCAGSSCGITWTNFTDDGCITGGQNGAHRSYADPGSVASSPWSILTSPDGLRFDFEDSADDEQRNESTNTPPVAGAGHGETGEGCASYNHFRQAGTATGTFTLSSDGFLAIAWEGMAEQEDPFFELMQVEIDGVPIASAHAPGGLLACAPMAPVVSVPPSPYVFPLAAGAHTVSISIDSADSWFHVNAYYQFVLLCNQDGTACCQDGGPTASFTIDPALDEDENEIPCTFVFTSTSTPGACGDIASCQWEFVVTGAEGGPAVFYKDGCEVTVAIRDCENYEGGRFGCVDVIKARCGELTIQATLRVTDTTGCVGTATDEVSCGNDCIVEGTVSITQVDTCRYRFCAEVDWETTTCDIPFVEISLGGGAVDYDCTCEQFAEDAEFYDCDQNTITLGDGDCTERNIRTSLQVRWRWWDKACGCPGPWHDYGEITCTECNCCDGVIDGAIVTVEGVTTCPDDGALGGRSCPCLSLDASYNVPATAPCTGLKEFPMTCTFGDPPVPGDITVGVQWFIFCNEDGYWISLVLYITNGSLVETTEAIIFLGDEKPICTEILDACGSSEDENIACFWCEVDGVSLCASVYAL